MIVALIAAVMGWVFAFGVNIMDARERQAIRLEHERVLAREQRRVDDLIQQVQVSSQGLPYYPQIGPIEQAPERHFLTDDTGLIEVEYDPEDDRDFVDATSL